MKKIVVIIAVPAAFLLGAAGGFELAGNKYESIMAKLGEVDAVRSELAEERCNERVITVLEQVDMECFGRWSTADGPIVLYPENKKEGK